MHVYCHPDYTPQAVSENIALKQSLFKSISEAVNPNCIMASNTSSISITKIAASTIPQGVSASSGEGVKFAERVVGQ